MSALQTTTELLRLLSEPTRVRLLALLGREELTVAELTGVTQLSQSRVSTHLGKLREAHSAVGGGSNFKAAIEQLNTTLFNAKGCHAVYAEYGGKGGQKAMTVYTKEVWDSLPE